jgi:molybdopterin synthase sulfur carrier subunit
MPTITFTANLNRHLDCPSCNVAAGDVRQALDVVFEVNPRLKGYLLDDQGCVRQHITVFVDGQPIHDRDGLSDAVDDASEILVMQALSGG